MKVLSVGGLLYESTSSWSRNPVGAHWLRKGLLRLGTYAGASWTLNITSYS